MILFRACKRQNVKKNIPIRVATSAERYCGGEQKWWSQPVSRPPCTPNQQAIANYNKFIANYSKLYPGGPIPQNMAKTFDGPPTLERSGSEHRRAVTSFLLRRKAWLEVELPLERETEGFEKILLLWEKAMPMSAMKARFQIAECSSLYQQRRTG